MRVDIDYLISVIVPVYNAEQYLKRCLESLVKQESVNLEIILVDDGSNDRSGKICDDYAKKDPRIVVIHQENKGASNARNHGLQVARGAYIGFVDSDDWIEPDMYRYLLHLIQKYHADAAVCDYERAVRPQKVKERKEKLQLRTKKELERFFYRLDGGKSFFSVWNCLYQKNLLKDISFLENQINEDIYFTYEVYKKADRIIFSNLQKYFYFFGCGTVTQNKVCRKDNSQFFIWDKIVEQERHTNNYQAAVFNRARATFNLYMKARLFGISDEMPVDTLKCWRRELKTNYRLLMKGHALDNKRKLALFLICRLHW